MEKNAKIERELREKCRSGGPLKITAKSLKSMKFDCVEFEKSLLSFMLKIDEKKRDISENYERKVREIDEKITKNRGEAFEKKVKFFDFGVIAKA